MRLTKLFFIALLALALFGCTGEGGSDFGPKGIGFSSENPRVALPGQTFHLLVFASAQSGEEENQIARIRITATGATPVNPNLDLPLGRYLENSYRTIQLTVPAGTAIGTAIDVRIERDIAALHVTRSESYTLTVGNNLISAALAPAAVTGPAGSSVNSTLTLTSHGTAAGQVTVVSLLGGVTATPDRVTLTRGGTANVAIRYLIPAGTPAGAVIELPVVFQAQDGHGFAMLRVTVATVVQPDFALALNRNNLNVTPGDSTDSVTVTITPQPGFRGDVSVQVTFPHPSLSLTPPTTSPFVMTVNSDAPVTSSFRVRWNAQQGFPQGQAVVTGTRGAQTHSANFSIIAS